MSRFRVGVIGCGRRLRTEGATGYGMSHWHAVGYEESPDCEIVALADLKRENAEAFSELHGGDNIYTDYHEMLRKEKLDIVSVCTWPALHAEMVISAAQSGVKAIYCEKPMAPTYGEAKRMVEECESHGVSLCINHQRRFLPQFRQARQLLKEGAIGKLLRIELSTVNLLDWGTHWFDMAFFYNDETPVEWVLGQIEAEGGGSVFGVRMERQAISHFRFTNDVNGLMVTGNSTGWEAQNRLVGDQGVIEVHPDRGGLLRYWTEKRPGWKSVDITPQSDLDITTQGVLDMVNALKEGREPELSGQRALRATELIFGTYESSRRRGRVDLPLRIEDSPLQAMLDEAGV